MPPKVDLLGMRFGRLTVTGDSGIRQGHSTVWICMCDCGNFVHIQGNNLRSGHSKSCGCLNSELSSARARRHGMSKTPIWNIWMLMRKRCTDEGDYAYPEYGGRGITVCDRWMESFDNFYEDMGPRPDGLSLERKDVNGNYEPDNCKWADWSEQSRNMRDRIAMHPVVRGVRLMKKYNPKTNNGRIGEMYGLSRQTVGNILSGRVYSYVSDEIDLRCQS